MESTNLEQLPLKENDNNIVIPLGEDRLLTLSIQFHRDDIQNIAVVLAQLLTRQLNSGIIECLIHHGLTNNMSKDIDDLIRYITLYQLDRMPVVSALEVFSKIEKGG